MIPGDLRNLSLFDALNLCEFTLASGTLWARSSRKSGALYLSSGELTFAELEGRELATIDAERAGLDGEIWTRTAEDADNHGSMVSALSDAGANHDSVRRFVRQRIEHVLAELVLVDDLEIDLATDEGWFGSELAFPAATLIEAARVINFGGQLIAETASDALIALCPTDGSNVTLGADHWNVMAELIGAIDLGELRDKIGHTEAVEFVRFLQSRSLATAIVAMPSIE